MIKRIIALFMLVCMSVGLVACSMPGKVSADGENDKKVNSEWTPNYTEVDATRNEPVYAVASKMNLNIATENKINVNSNHQYGIMQLAAGGEAGTEGSKNSHSTGALAGTFDNSLGPHQSYGFMWKSFVCPVCHGDSPYCDSTLSCSDRIENSLVSYKHTSVAMFVVYKETEKNGGAGGHQWKPWDWRLVNYSRQGYPDFTPGSYEKKWNCILWNTHDQTNGHYAKNSNGWKYPFSDENSKFKVLCLQVAANDGYNIGSPLSEVEKWYKNSSGKKLSCLFITKMDMTNDPAPAPVSNGGDSVESIKDVHDEKGVLNVSNPLTGVTVDLDGAHTINNKGLVGNNHCLSTAGNFLDTRPDTVTTHTHGESKRGTGNQQIYENPVKLVNWHFDTPEGEEHYFNKITMITQFIEKRTVHCEYCDNGCCYWVCNSCKSGCCGYHLVHVYHTHYERRPGNTYTRTFEYNMESPTLEYMIFNPYNLNRNGPCNPVDWENTEYNINYPDINLRMSVDNKQGIHGGIDDVSDDSNNIRMLDTNEAIPWSLTVNNDQLGIPNESDGGFKMYDSAQNFGFAMSRNRSTIQLGTISSNSNELTAAGLGGQAPTQQDISYIVHYDPQLYQAYNVAMSKIFTVSEDGSGEYDASTWKQWKNRSYTGTHNFVNRSVFYGDKYALSGNWSNEFWEVWYQETRYFTYGLCLAGYCEIDNSIPIRWKHSHQLYYENSVSNNEVVQPWLRGNFVVKTVGGNVG